MMTPTTIEKTKASNNNNNQQSFRKNLKISKLKY